MKVLNEKLNEYFGGKVVRKDLTKLVKGNAIVDILAHVDPPVMVSYFGLR